MTADGLCFHCLTDDNAEIPAVTSHRGTALCEKCAREWALQLRQAEAEQGQRIAQVEGRLAALRPGT
jgi:hypothetical protein